MRSAPLDVFKRVDGLVEGLAEREMSADVIVLSRGSWRIVDIAIEPWGVEVQKALQVIPSFGLRRIEPAPSDTAR